MFIYIYICTFISIVFILRKKGFKPVFLHFRICGSIAEVCGSHGKIHPVIATRPPAGLFWLPYGYPDSSAGKTGISGKVPCDNLHWCNGWRKTLHVFFPGETEFFVLFSPDTGMPVSWPPKAEVWFEKKDSGWRYFLFDHGDDEDDHDDSDDSSNGYRRIREDFGIPRFEQENLP